MATPVFEPGSSIVLPSLLVTPGPDLACAIGVLVFADLTPAGQVEVAAACQRLARWTAGTQLLVLAEYGRSQVWVGEPDARDDPTGIRAKQYGASDLDALLEFTDREVSCALGIGALSAAAKLGMAQDLDQRLPGTRAAMIAGVLDEPKARLIVRATRVLKTSDAAVVEAQVLPRAATWSYHRLTSELARLVIAADPASASERHERARARRVVSKQRRGDGMGTLTADLTADDLTTVWNALDAHARTSQAYTGRGQGDDRSIGQRRADGLVDLCADYLDGVLAGNLDYRAPRTATGWSTYRPTRPEQPAATVDHPDTTDHPGPATPDPHAEPATGNGRRAEPANDHDHPAEPATGNGRRAEPASDTGRRAGPATASQHPTQPSRVVAPRVLTEAMLKRLRSVLTRRCMITSTSAPTSSSATATTRSTSTATAGPPPPSGDGSCARTPTCAASSTTPTPASSSTSP